jgi:hypothetical protein
MLKRIRYAAWLPLVHLAIMAPLIALEEAKGWKYLPVQQRIEDYEKIHPPSPRAADSSIGWDPYSEYRPSTAEKAVLTAELPAALLAVWGGHLPGHDSYSESSVGWRRLLRSLASVQTRILILDSLLIVAICAQWWLVGRRLDRFRSAGKQMEWIQVPALVITSAGVLMALLSRGTHVWELIAAIAALLALLGWLLLILEAITAVAKLAFQQLRGRSASAWSSQTPHKN